MEQKKKWRKILKEYILITVGLFLYTFAWVAFLIPNETIGGGATGMATVLYYVSGKYIPVSVGFFVLNGVLVLVGIKILGKNFGVKIIYGIITTSLFLLLPEPAFITNSFLPEDKLLTAIIGGALSGIGIFIALQQGGGAGGTDIVVMILNKYRSISPGRVYLYCDLIIIGASFFINWDFRTIIYGYVVMGVFSYAVDLFLSGAKQSIQLFIFSKKYPQIADRITRETGRGVTLIDGKGWYTQEDGKVMMTVTRKTDSNVVFRIVREEDNDAFISVNSVMGVYGKGFEEIRRMKS